MLLRETPSKLPGQNAHVLPGLHPAQGFKFELATKSAWFVGGQTSPPPQEGELSPFSVSQARGALHNCYPSPRKGAGCCDRGFKTEVRYIALPTTNEATFCYWRHAG